MTQLFLLNVRYVYGCSPCMYIYAPLTVQKKVLDTLDLELLEIVNCCVDWMLRTETGSHGRGTNVLHHLFIFPAPHFYS